MRWGRTLCIAATSAVRSLQKNALYHRGEVRHKVILLTIRRRQKERDKHDHERHGRSDRCCGLLTFASDKLGGLRSTSQKPNHPKSYDTEMVSHGGVLPLLSCERSLLKPPQVIHTSYLEAYGRDAVRPRHGPRHMASNGI